MAGGRGERLFPLTREVAKPAVTFGGIYKIIDFTLSNCFNSGIRRIYLLTQYSNLTMHRHIRIGWNPLFRHELDEFVEQLPPQHRGTEDWYHGTTDSIYQNIEVLERHKPEYVLILSGDHIYKMDYSRMLEYHMESNAELTIAAVEVDREQASGLGVMQVDNRNKVTDFAEKSDDPPPIPDRPNRFLASMGIYVFSTKKLVRELIADSKNRESKHDFGKNLIPALVDGKDRVFAYRFSDEDTAGAGYWRDIGTLDSYFSANIDLVHPNPEFDLYDRHWPIRTTIRQNPPARIVGSTVKEKLSGLMSDSLVSSGSILSGCRVERSVLSPDVRVHTDAHVEESILMEGADVGRGSVIRQAILCPGVHVPDGAAIGVDPDADRERFMVTQNGVAVVPGDFIW